MEVGQSGLEAGRVSPAAALARASTAEIVKAPRRRPVQLDRWLLQGLLVLAVMLAALPLVWMVLSSLKPDAENAAYPPTLLPRVVTLESYAELFRISDFGTYLRNSAALAAGSTAATLVLATLAAYSMTRFRFPVLRELGELSLFAYMLPPILLVVPIAQIVTGLGLGNSLGAVAIVYTAHLLPFGLWILRSYFLGMSEELEYAGMVDGCTRFGAFWRITLPQATPGLLSTAVFTFNAAWSEYLFASVLLTSADSLTLSPGLALLMDQTGVYSWGMLMAASVLVTLPVVALFVLAQTQLVSGWSEGALKG